MLSRQSYCGNEENHGNDWTVSSQMEFEGEHLGLPRGTAQFTVTSIHYSGCVNILWFKAEINIWCALCLYKLFPLFPSGEITQNF
jgi:hypothetical protein